MSTDTERSEGLAELLNDADAYVAGYRVEYDAGFDDEEDEEGFECASCGNARGWPYHDAGCVVLMVEGLAATIRDLQAQVERLTQDREDMREVMMEACDEANAAERALEEIGRLLPESGSGIVDERLVRAVMIARRAARLAAEGGRDE